jgi:hypothetical protein
LFFGASIRCMGFAVILSLFLSPQWAASQSSCQAVAESDLVFIGTVETVAPHLLDTWTSDASRDWMQDPELVELGRDKSEAGLSTLKARYLKLLSDLPEGDKGRIAAAATQEQLQTVMIEKGTSVRFKVRTLFQQKEDSAADEASHLRVRDTVPNDLCDLLIRDGFLTTAR